jgi:signal transduction histidine kinase
VLVERARASTDLDLDCRFETEAAADHASRLPPDLEIAVYRLVQEAVNNAIKHADASRIEIAIADGDGVLRARVSDDGAGFDPAQADEGFGLTGMRERAALLGGRVAIDSTIGRGTVVEAELPIVSALDQVVVEREAN